MRHSGPDPAPTVYYRLPTAPAAAACREENEGVETSLTSPVAP